MKCIKIITDEDFNLEVNEFDNPRIRLGARGIVFNDKKEIAILHKVYKNEYKLVGGGIEENENPINAFKREVLEETGFKIKVDDCLGTIREEKSQDNFIQISTVYVAHIVGNFEKTSFTQEEIDDGAKLLWLSIDDAINKIKSCEKNLVASKHEGNLSVYHTRFIVRRDYTILKYYTEKILKKNKK